VKNDELTAQTQELLARQNAAGRSESTQVAQLRSTLAAAQQA
jgi:hypothetical protein